MSSLKLKFRTKRRSWTLDNTNRRIRRAFSDPLKSLTDIAGVCEPKGLKIEETPQRVQTNDAVSCRTNEQEEVQGCVEYTNSKVLKSESRGVEGRTFFKEEPLKLNDRSERDNGDVEKEEDSFDYLTDFFKVPVAVAGWFILGISISNLNKMILSNFKFNFPIALTTFQMMTSFCINHVLLTLTPLRKYNTPLRGRVLGQIYLLSIIFAASIALGNIGLKYLYVSFAKMIMATSPAVTVVLAKCMSGIQLTQRTYTSLIPLCGGTILCAVGEINFHWIGFAAMIGCTVLRAFRSLLEGRLLKEENVNSLSLLYHISLPSSILLMLATAYWEGPELVEDYSTIMDPGFILSILASCLNGIVYNILTFVVTFYTSPLTLKVLGNGSILLNIAVSVFLFNHSLSETSILGIMVTLLGIILYQKSFGTK